MIAGGIEQRAAYAALLLPSRHRELDDVQRGTGDAGKQDTGERTILRPSATHTVPTAIGGR